MATTQSPRIVLRVRSNGNVADRIDALVPDRSMVPPEYTLPPQGRHQVAKEDYLHEKRQEATVQEKIDGLRALICPPLSRWVRFKAAVRSKLRVFTALLTAGQSSGYTRRLGLGGRPVPDSENSNN